MFIDHYRSIYGVEPICKILPIAPSTYYRCHYLIQQPDERSYRERRDEVLGVEIDRVWVENHKVYGARKIWKQLNRESIWVARCTVERLMRKLRLEGIRRGRRCRTTLPSDRSDKPLDLVNRQFIATKPNQLWVADITYVATWSGFVYVAFVTDMFSLFLVG